MRKQRSAKTNYVGLYVLPRGTLRSELLVALRRRARRAGLGHGGQPAAARSRI